MSAIKNEFGEEKVADLQEFPLNMEITPEIPADLQEFNFFRDGMGGPARRSPYYRGTTSFMPFVLQRFPCKFMM